MRETWGTQGLLKLMAKSAALKKLRRHSKTAPALNNDAGARNYGRLQKKRQP
jgi:sulfur transfer complex TusBCD TusB component (DsrH family)